VNLLKILQNIAARRSSSGAPPEVAETETTLPGIAAVRERIAELRVAQAAHADLVSQREQSASESGALAGRLDAAKAQLSAREREIALSGSPLQDGILPEEEEVERLKRQLRICQARVAEWDKKVAEDKRAVDAKARNIEYAWNSFGADIDELLYSQWCATAAAMRDVWFTTLAFGRCFGGQEPWWRWRFLRQTFTILDPRDGTPILNPALSAFPVKWTAPATTFLAELQSLRAEIKSATGGAANGNEPLSDED
jgi:hypothetical protein